MSPAHPSAYKSTHGMPYAGSRFVILLISPALELAKYAAVSLAL